jgi:esterase/lipase superfamily enzyme
LPAIIETDDVRYITYNDENYRTIAHAINGVITFKQRLSTLLLQFVNNKLDNFVYFVSSNNLHYLINVHKVKRINNINKCTIIFDNDERLTIDNSYAYHALEKMVIDEAKDSGEVHHSSQSNS